MRFTSSQLPRTFCTYFSFCMASLQSHKGLIIIVGLRNASHNYNHLSNMHILWKPFRRSVSYQTNSFTTISIRVTKIKQINRLPLFPGVELLFSTIFSPQHFPIYFVMHLRLIVFNFTCSLLFLYSIALVRELFVEEIDVEI